MASGEINELIELVKTQIAKNKSPIASTVLQKLDTIKMNEELTKSISSDHFTIIHKTVEKILRQLLRNKDRLNEDVLSKTDESIADLKSVIKQMAKSMATRPNNYMNNFTQLRDKSEELKESNLAANDKAEERFRLIEDLKMIQAKVDLFQDHNFNSL